MKDFSPFREDLLKYFYTELHKISECIQGGRSIYYPPMNTLLPINSTQFIGPAPSPQKDRDKYAHRLNETSSLTDRIFGKTVPREFGFPAPEKLIDHYADSMEHHIEKRVAIFFQQLVACYQTKLHFEIGKTLNQGESAPALMASKNGTIRKLCPRNAAHSSTIPCLIAYRGSEWDAHQRDELEVLEGFVYLKGSHIYGLCNSTIDMPRAINEADIAIDGNSEGSALRTKSLALLNKAAQGDLTPVKGLKNFLLLLINTVHEKRGTVAKEDVRKALEYYEKILNGIQNSIANDPEIFSHWLDIQVDPSDESSLMRKTIYHIRYGAIRNNLLSQALIIDMIETVRKQIFNQMKTEKRYCFAEEAFRQVLVELAAESDRPRLRKLFNLPAETNRKPTYETTKARILKEKKLLLPLLKELSRKMAQMRNDEISHRSSLTKTLREVKGWTQDDLSAKIKKNFPSLPSSRSTISRVETGAKSIDSNYASKLSKVFKVDAGLFMPHFFHD